MELRDVSMRGLPRSLALLLAAEIFDDDDDDWYRHGNKHHGGNRGNNNTVIIRGAGLTGRVSLVRFRPWPPLPTS
jgi:hypothetical protein